VSITSAAEDLNPHHVVEIKVNNNPVRIDGPKATGLQIKEAAIAQGVPIQVTFQLSEKLEDHKTKIIGDTDVVDVRNGLTFVAVADDDNS
jgi:hypothetical protein